MRLLLLCCVLLAACTAAPPDTPPLLVHGGTILTMDADQPVVEAMLIENGRVVGIGTEAELARRFTQPQRHDLGGRTVIPGVVDAHAHVAEIGLDWNKADLTGAETVAEMVERLRATYPEPTPGEWLVGAGWDEGVWASLGYPDRAELDAAFPDNPVALESAHGFAGFYNAAALAAADVDADTPEPAIGRILRRPDVAPTGVLLTSAQALVQAHVPPPSGEQLKAAILTGLDALVREGVTSVHEAGVGPVEVAAYRELADEGLLPIRVNLLLNGNDSALVDAWLDHGPLDREDGFLAVRGFKVFYDGSLGSRTALLRAPYADDPDAAVPTERISPATIRVLAERAAERGFQLAVHAIGDEGNDRVLTIYEDVLAAHPGLDHRWRIEHAQAVLPDFFQRAARLGVVASMQPSHAVGDSRWAEDRLGDERVRRAYAWRTMLDEGIRLSFNSDLPGEPWTPMQTLYFAVTRQPLGGGPAWYPEQATTVDEALHAMTRAGAHAAFQDDVGCLAPGCRADFVELATDPRAANPATLADIDVVHTWVGGDLRVDADGAVLPRR